MFSKQILLILMIFAATGGDCLAKSKNKHPVNETSLSTRGEQQGVYRNYGARAATASSRALPGQPLNIPAPGYSSSSQPACSTLGTCSIITTTTGTGSPPPPPRHCRVTSSPPRHCRATSSPPRHCRRDGHSCGRWCGNSASQALAGMGGVPACHGWITTFVGDQRAEPCSRACDRRSWYLICVVISQWASI